MIRTLLATVLLAVTTTASNAGTLDALRWKNRVLLLFSGQAENPLLRRQAALLLADEGALAERDLVVATVTGDRIATIFGPPLEGETAVGLRARLSIDRAEGFTTVLIGKDGGTKWRAEKPTPLADINAVIDAMPMRRSER